MKNHNKNKLKMYKAVQHICTLNQAYWIDLPAFVNSFAAFSAQLGQLDQLSEKQSLRLMGVRADLDVQRSATIEKAIAMQGALIAFAKDTENNVLRESLRFSKSQLQGGSYALCIQRIHVISQNAAMYLSNLNDYGITQASVEDLELNLTALEEAFNTPRAAIVDRKQFTASIEELIKEIDRVLRDKLDQLMLVLRPSHPEFYDRYHYARAIIEYKGKGNHSTPPDGAKE
jgi:hypothetical protein